MLRERLAAPGIRGPGEPVAPPHFVLGGFAFLAINWSYCRSSTKATTRAMLASPSAKRQGKHRMVAR